VENAGENAGGSLLGAAYVRARSAYEFWRYCRRIAGSVWTILVILALHQSVTWWEPIAWAPVWLAVGWGEVRADRKARHHNEVQWADLQAQMTRGERIEMTGLPLRGDEQTIVEDGGPRT
jgi:hypothetical protein